MSYYATKYFNNFFTIGKELANHFINKVLKLIKQMSSYTENCKNPHSSSDLKKDFQ